MYFYGYDSAFVCPLVYREHVLKEKELLVLIALLCGLNSRVQSVCVCVCALSTALFSVCL